MLDLACGPGRHVRYLASRGHKVVACDRDGAALLGLEGVTGVETVRADLEDGSPWPFGTRQFQGIVVTNYLHRPLFAAIASALSPGGVLIYETFALGNEQFGKPSNPDFLLRKDELLGVSGPGWRWPGLSRGLSIARSRRWCSEPAWCGPRRYSTTWSPETPLIRLKFWARQAPKEGSAMITGSLVAIATPMHDDGRLDMARFRALIDFHINEGTDGIVVVGTTGESPTVDFDEHKELIRVAVEHAKGRIPIIAGTGGN